LFYDQYAKPGDNLRLEAVILGSPKPKVWWKLFIINLNFKIIYNLIIKDQMVF
jgi:hypothetical protein